MSDGRKNDEGTSSDRLRRPPSPPGEGLKKALEERRAKENARIQEEADRYNGTPGVLNIDHVGVHGELVRGDAIDCERCLNRGSMYVVLIDEGGRAQRFYKTCECITTKTREAQGG